MKIFIDEQLINEIQFDTFDLGIVEAGKTKEFVFYVFNDSKASLINLTFKIEHKEIEMLDYPTELQPQEVGELKFKWSPLVTLKEGLQTEIKIFANELWG